MLSHIIRYNLRAPINLKIQLQRACLACAYLVIINFILSMHYSIKSPRSKYLADSVSGSLRRNDGFPIHYTQNILRIKTIVVKGLPLPLCTKIPKAFNLKRLCRKCAYSFPRGNSVWVTNSMRRWSTKKGTRITKEDNAEVVHFFLRIKILLGGLTLKTVVRFGNTSIKGNNCVVSRELT